MGFQIVDLLLKGLGLIGVAVIGHGTRNGAAAKTAQNGTDQGHGDDPAGALMGFLFLVRIRGLGAVAGVGPAVVIGVLTGSLIGGGALRLGSGVCACGGLRHRGSLLFYVIFRVGIPTIGFKVVHVLHLLVFY